jgi:acetyl esterase/lipase
MFCAMPALVALALVFGMPGGGPVTMADETRAMDQKGDAPSPDLTLNVWPALAPGEQTVGASVGNMDESDHILRLTSVTRPDLLVFRAKGRGPHPAVLVCPGGGYAILAENLEGTEIAHWLNSVGFAAVVLNYRVPGKRDGAFQDVQRAMSLVRHQAAEWGIDPKRLGVMGFSAGAHLSARLSCGFGKRSYDRIDDVDDVSCRPDFTLLIYPAYLVDKETGKTPADVQPTADTPPMFLAQSRDDVVLCAPSYAKALDEAGVPERCVMYETGGHGYGIRAKADVPVHAWPREAAAWLHHQAGKRK